MSPFFVVWFDHDKLIDVNAVSVDMRNRGLVAVRV